MNDGEPGLTRVGHAKTLRLRGVDGAAVRDSRIRERVRWLAIPPAWTNVWICPTPRGHIQAMGRDQRGRRQYIYHPAWRALRDRAKFDRLVAFAQALARIRARVARDLAKRTLCRERVLALVVHLLDTTHVRVGNEEYARNNGSFGLTTLRDRHARITGSSLLFEFRAKSGKVQRLRLSGRKLARMVKACQDLPGQRLFQYLDNGVPKPITSSDVNGYLREISGDDLPLRSSGHGPGRCWPLRSSTRADRTAKAVGIVCRLPSRLWRTSLVTHPPSVGSAISILPLSEATEPVRWSGICAPFRRDVAKSRPRSVTMRPLCLRSSAGRRGRLSAITDWIVARQAADVLAGSGQPGTCDHASG